MINLPKVSIVMPSFNSSKYIVDSIESVKNQLYQNWELIIVDDNSSDNTVMLIQSVISRCDNIKLYVNDNQKGAAYCRNKAIELASGDYIAFLDADDLWLKSKLLHQMEFMLKNNYKMTYTNYLVFFDDQNWLNGKVKISPKIVTKKSMLQRNRLGCLTVIVESEIAKKSKIPNIITKRNDYALWLKILNYTDGYNVGSVEAYYRKVSNSLSSGSKLKLLKYHYKVFRFSEGDGVFRSLINTMRNMIYYIFESGV